VCCHARFLKVLFLGGGFVMAEDDIYESKGSYERFVASLSSRVGEGSLGRRRRGVVKYCIRNPENLKHFYRLDAYLKAKDLSFVRRIRVFRSLTMLAHLVEKDFASCNREDMNCALSFMHSVYQSPRSKVTFIRDIKYVWRILFPDVDEKGRPDETIVPYAVRHISARIDKSREKMRKDKFSWEEFETLVNYFGRDPRIQAFLTLSLESLARPQELLYVKIGDVELMDNYARIYISEHGKEGTGLLQCIDSYPYLVKWLNIHPRKNDKSCFLFVNVGNSNKLKQLKPDNVNKKIASACKMLQIQKPITCYSLKRNGVTVRRLRGESDMEIQHAARWTSTRQLKTYDLSNQDEAFKKELQKRGLIPQDANTTETLKTKICGFCNTQAGFSETICPNCKRPLDRKVIVEETQKKDRQIQELQQQVSTLNLQFATVRQQIMQEVMAQILQAKNGLA